MQIKTGWFVLVVLLGLLGCAKLLDENSDEDQERARDVLLISLQTWKAGQAATLSKRVHPIRFGDDDYRSGLTLIDFALEAPDVPIHPFRDVRVKLTMKDGAGTTQTRVVTYQIGLDPKVTVLRSDN